MKKILLFSLAVIFAGSVFSQQLIAPPVTAGEANENQISVKSTTAADYEEDFEGTATTTTVNVDGNSDDLAHTQSIVFDAGFISLTFGSGYFMSSNSVFDPAGNADRWMFTPQITGVSANAELSWDAATILIAGTAYASDYEIYIATSIAGATPAPSDFTTLLTTITDEPLASTFTHRTLDLSAYSGQDIYLAFRHISTGSDGTLGIDNIRVGSSISDDIRIVNTLVQMGTNGGYYGSIPTSQIQDFMFGANVDNWGSNDQTGIVLNVNVNTGVFDDNSPAESILSTDTAMIYTQNMQLLSQLLQIKSLL